MDSAREYPYKLLVGLIASLLIVAIGIADLFTSVLFGISWMPVVVLVVGLCGAFCGGAAFFSAKGLYRWSAALVAAVSIYALLRMIAFFGWAINLP